MFLNFNLNPTWTRVFLFIDILLTIGFGLTIVSLIIVTLVNGIAGVGIYYWFAFVAIGMLAVALIIFGVSAAVLIFHCLSSRAFELYPTDPWYKSIPRIFKKKSGVTSEARIGSKLVQRASELNGKQKKKRRRRRR